MKEELKSLDFLGFSDYSISDQGNLYSHLDTDYRDNRIRGKTHNKNVLRIVTPIKQRREHHEKQIRLVKNGERLTLNVSFLVASAFVNNPNDFKDVDYLDGNNNNINSSNLYWAQKKMHLVSGFTFTTKDGSTCKIIAQTDRQHVDVLLTSDNVVGNVKGIILNTTIKSVRRKQVRHPFVPSVCNYGCMGYGPHRCSETINGKEVRNTLHTRWLLMIARCKKPGSLAYYGVPISEEFRNFQNYAHLITELMKKSNIDKLDGFEVDKDFKSNKLLGYSRETIALVPVYLNSFLINRNVGSGVLPAGVGYSPTRNEIKSTLTDVNGVTIKRYLFSNDVSVNFDNVNTLVDLYIKEKAAKARNLLLRCYADYPNIILDNAVVEVLNNFEKYVIQNYHLKNEWVVEKTGDKYHLSFKMFDKVKNILL